MRCAPSQERIAGGTPGSLQLGFTVENVDTFVADARAMGVPVFQDPYDDPFGRIAVIADPDGYPIQVGTLARYPVTRQ